MKWKKRVNPFARPIAAPDAASEAPPELSPGRRDLDQPRQPSGERGVDLVFVIDTTGSMSDKIESLLATCRQFADDFNALHLNHRIAIVSFGDLRVPGDKIQNTAFTSNVETTKQSLRHIPRYSGGGNEGESSLEALERALSLPFRSNAVKAVVLITDEPADQHQLNAEAMIGRLTERQMLVFVASPPYKYFQRMALRNGGQWYRISARTNFNDLLKIFRDLATQVSQVVSDVYQIGDGSVGDYLRLRPPER
jgi:Mg-chelatase subunit ChlD